MTYFNLCQSQTNVGNAICGVNCSNEENFFYVSATESQKNGYIDVEDEC